MGSSDRHTACHSAQPNSGKPEVLVLSPSSFNQARLGGRPGLPRPGVGYGFSARLTPMLRSRHGCGALCGRSGGVDRPTAPAVEQSFVELPRRPVQPPWRPRTPRRCGRPRLIGCPEGEGARGAAQGGVAGGGIAGGSPASEASDSRSRMLRIASDYGRRATAGTRRPVVPVLHAVRLATKCGPSLAMLRLRSAAGSRRRPGRPGRDLWPPSLGRRYEELGQHMSRGPGRIERAMVGLCRCDDRRV